VAQLNEPAVQDYRRREVQESVNLLREFSEKGLKLVFEMPTPIFPTPLYRCSDWFNASNPICSDGITSGRDDLISYRAPVVAAIEEVRTLLPGVYAWDPFPVLCPESPCRMMWEGKPLFFDGDHISAYANRLLLPDFTKSMAALDRDAR